MVKRKQQISIFFYFFIIITILLTLSEACTKKIVPPQISDIKLKIQKVRAGRSTEASVDILSNLSNLSLKFEWSTSNGTIDQGSPTVKYQPEKPGNASISLNVKNTRNDSIVATKTLSFRVESPVPPLNVLADAVFAGWMGDGETFGERAITLVDGCTENPYTPPACVKIKYRVLPNSVDRWAGIYAQFNVRGQGNWGQRPGRDLSGYNKLVFYAKGEQGGEMVEFKAGGINAPGMPHKDSFEYTMGTIELKKEWTRYEMELSEEDLSSVIGAFCWVATARSNPNGLTFYIDSVTYE